MRVEVGAMALEIVEGPRYLCKQVVSSRARLPALTCTNNRAKSDSLIVFQGRKGLGVRGRVVFEGHLESLLSIKTCFQGLLVRLSSWTRPWQQTLISANDFLLMANFAQFDSTVP